MTKHNKKLFSIIAAVAMLTAEFAGFPNQVYATTVDILSDDTAVTTGIEEDGFSADPLAETTDGSQETDPEDDAAVIIDTADTAVSYEGELPYGLTGMSNYTPSTSDLHIKQEIMVHDVTGNLDKLASGTDYAPDQVIFEANSEAYANEVAKAYNAELISYRPGIATLRLDTAQISVAQAVALSADPAVPLPPVCPNYITKLTDPIPSSGLTSEELSGALNPEGTYVQPYDWSFWKEKGWTDPGLDPDATFEDPDDDGKVKKTYQWMHDTVGSYAAWGKDFKTNPGVTVAVIDSGVTINHEDFIPYGDNKSIVTDYHVIEEGEIDDAGHGTHVAGIIAARPNQKGGVGIAPNSNVSILSLPVFKKDGAYDDDIIAAINYVTNAGGTRMADIINMSLGSPTYNPLYQLAIDNAYSAGVTVCASMGNYHSNDICYPAGYNHVIAVAAVNISHARSNFSTYGAWADISAPGSAIFSAWNGSTEENPNQNKTDWYTVWNGTSMACPVVAGACAVYMDIYGHTDPDTMEAVLKKSATKIKGSGLGAGIVNVAAMIQSDDLAPLITGQDSIDSDPVPKEVPLSSLTADDYIVFRDDPKSTSGTNAYVYTIDSVKPAYKNGDASGNVGYAHIIPGPSAANNGYAIPVKDLIYYGVTSGQPSTIMVGRVDIHGKFSKIATATITATFDPSTIPEGLYIYGPDGLAKGKSAKYYAYRFPDYTKSEVTMSVAGDGVTLNPKNGKVKVKKSASGDSFVITATSGTLTATKTVRILTPAKGVKITVSANELVNAPKRNKKGDITSLRLYNQDIARTTDIEENRIQLSGNVIGNDLRTVFTSSNPSVAEVDGSGLVTAHRPGKTKITCMANDGSKKKASVTIQVIVPASDLTLISKQADHDVIGYGKSGKLTAVPGRTYGKPSITKARWFIQSVEAFSSAGASLGNMSPSQVEQDKLITVKNGKVKISKKMPGVAAYYLITVGAETTDGTKIQAFYSLYATKPAKTFKALDKSGLKAKPKYFYTMIGSDPYNSFDTIVIVTDAATSPILGTGKVLTRPQCTSSNPRVMSVTMSDVKRYSATELAFIYRMEAHKKGTAKLTFKSTDGTNKKASVKFFVR